jgi:hypothetical protein
MLAWLDAFSKVHRFQESSLRVLSFWTFFLGDINRFIAHFPIVCHRYQLLFFISFSFINASRTALVFAYMAA